MEESNQPRDLKKRIEDRTYERDNLRVLVKKLKAENEELKEGHSLIYKSLRQAEGIKELMTGPEFECIAEAVSDYVSGFHELQNDIEAYENMTGVKRDVIIAHNDPTNDEHYTYKTCEEYEEELGEMED